MLALPYVQTLRKFRRKDAPMTRSSLPVPFVQFSFEVAPRASGVKHSTDGAVHRLVPDPSPQVREALNDACLAVFKLSLQRLFEGRELRKVLLGFAAHYQHL